MTLRLLVGHVLERLAELPAESVHCVVTSPPYYGLRDWDRTKWPRTTKETETIGWLPTCECSGRPTWECDASLGIVPATVLDPFFGAGATGLVADQLQRDCIGIELNPEYAEMARRRLTEAAPLFAEVAE